MDLVFCRNCTHHSPTTLSYELEKRLNVGIPAFARCLASSRGCDGCCPLSILIMRSCGLVNLILVLPHVDFLTSRRFRLVVPLRLVFRLLLVVLRVAWVLREVRLFGAFLPVRLVVAFDRVALVVVGLDVDSADVDSLGPSSESPVADVSDSDTIMDAPRCNLVVFMRLRTRSLKRVRAIGL